jgi:type IV pilus assembly protein PilN
MTSLFHGPVDLLRQRRLEVGLPGEPPRTKPAWQLLLLGGGLGAGLFLPSVALVFALGLWDSFLQKDLLRLNGMPAQVKALERQLKGSQARVKQLETSNQGLARGLIGVSSGSAVISNLFQLSPAGVELKEVSVVGPALSLKGGASDPDAFKRINALQLQMAYSPMFQPDSVKVLKVTREGDEDLEAPSQVAFDLAGSFQILTPVAQLKQLQRLGATGMARRLEILQAAGVLQ